MHRRSLLLWLAFLSMAVPVAGQGTDEAINLRAEVQQVEGDVWRGTGGVRILYQDIAIQCDEMQYNRVTEELVARGNVILDQGPKRFTADELRFDLGDKTGTMINATGFMPPMYTFSGSVIEKLDETHYRIENASFTTCESPDGSPPWSFKVREVLLEEEGYGHFHGTAIKVQGAPVFYLPYFVWPVKRDRSPGLLMPGFGYSQLRGTYVGLPVYLPLGRSYDTTLLFDYFSNGYYGLGTEWRWAPVADANGILNLYTIWDDNAGQWQWKLNGSHRQDDFYGFRLQAELEDLSDVDFFQEFERDFDRSTRRDVYSYFYLTKSWGPGSLNVRADRRVTFDLVSAPATSSDVELRQLPEVELRVRPTRIGRSSLYWDMISSFNYFDVDRGGDLATSYARADLFPSLSYTLPSPLWLTVTPRVGGRATYYTARYSEDRRSFVDDPVSRLYATGGVDIVGPSVSRVFNNALGSYSRFKHVIEPRIEYDYLDGTEDTSMIPVFDEVDTTRFTNRARVVLANRLLGRSREGVSARELGSLELWQEYSFSDPLTRGVERDSQWGSLNALLRVFPTPATGFDARASFDSLHHNLISTSLAASLRRPIGWLNLTWYQNYNPRSGERLSSQVRTMVAYRQRDFPLRATVHLAYDIERAEFQQQQFQVNWEGSCWSLALEYRDLRLGAFPTRDWRIVVSLKGVGALPEIRGSLNPMGN
jgi:LPS-assembly protein